MTPVALQGTVSHLTKIWPMLGCGVGLRSEHYDWIIRHRPQMDWFEAVTENFMDSRGRPLFLLEEVRKHYPVALHGVSLSIGSTDLLNREYLKRLKALVDRIAPEIVSDHLCWSGVAGRCLHDLLPLPFTEEAIRHVVRRIQQVQEFLGRTILLENVSAYITYRHSEMREWEFLREVAKRSGCGILLDLNNIYVNSVNHEFDPYEYLRNIPGEKIGQFHLSGHADMGKYLFDSHGQEVIASVWDLYRQALKQWGAVTTLVEWDENIPDFPRLSEEAGKARALYAEITSGKRRIFEGTPSDALLVSSTGGAPQTDPPLGLRLRTLQDWMKSHIQPEGEETPSLSDSDSPLNPQGGEPGLSRMSVYASGYLARMKEALEEVYEAVRHITGETLFGDLARDYAKQFPSRHYNLSRAGIHFSRFLKQAAIFSKLPFLSDLARLEWSVNQAFHAPAKPPFQRAELQSVTADQWHHLVFEFQPFVSMVSSEWPILDLWQARQTARKEIDIQVEGRSQHVLVYRKGLKVHCELIDQERAFVLEKLRSGESLGKMCEALAGETKDSSSVTRWFQEWTQKGLITALRSSPP